MEEDKEVLLPRGEEYIFGEEAILENDIKILEEMLGELDENGAVVLNLANGEALENLLTRYKQLEEENRTLKRVNNMTEDISIEDITQVMDKSYKDFMKEFFPKSKIKEKIDKTKFYIPEYQGEFVAIEDLENVLEEE